MEPKIWKMMVHASVKLDFLVICVINVLKDTTEQPAKIAVKDTIGTTKILVQVSKIEIHISSIVHNGFFQLVNVILRAHQ